MAIYLLRANWDQLTDIDRDMVVWSWHVDSEVQPAADTLESIVAGSMLSANTGNFPGLFTNNFALREVQVYNSDVGGPPVDQALPAAPVDGTATGADGPGEVAIVVSRWVNDALGRPRKFGRQYFGVFSAAAIAGPRPAVSQRTSCLNAAEYFHQQFVGQGWTPIVRSRTLNPPGRVITQYSCDDAWDTQRRRGVDPTTEEIRVPAAL